MAQSSPDWMDCINPEEISLLLPYQEFYPSATFFETPQVGYPSHTATPDIFDVPELVPDVDVDAILDACQYAPVTDKGQVVVSEPER
jgi:hypothetical protein